MQRFVPILVATFAISLAAISSHAQSKFELYGGYSYLRPAMSQTEADLCTGPVCPLSSVVFAPAIVTTHPNLNGWDASGTYRVIRWLGVTADFSGHYGTALGSSSARVHTFLFGPEARWRGHVSPFAHVLFGGAHASSNTGTLSNNPPYNTVLSASNTAFASAFGGGIDARVVPSVWVRLIQLDYLMTRFNSNTQNQPRVSAGVVLHF
jgi:hypothetical protein